MISRRLGCELPQLRPIQCICSGHPRIDLLGTHLIACKHGGQRHQTHDFMVHEIYSCVKACGLYSKTERTNFFRSVSADNGKRPDLGVRGFDRGILGDVIITSHLSSQLTVQNKTLLRQQRGSRTRNFKKILLQQTCCFFHSLSKPMAAGETSSVSFLLN